MKIRLKEQTKAERDVTAIGKRGGVRVDDPRFSRNRRPLLGNNAGPGPAPKAEWTNKK
jgi:hypothetical protein